MMECTVSRLRVTTLYAVICLVLFNLTRQTYSQPLDVEQETSLADITSLFSSFSSSESGDGPLTDRRPCVFRGDLKLHEETWTLDPCTLCECNNGTSECRIVTCPKPKCDNPVRITGECCIFCPYKMQFFNIFNHFSSDARVTEGKRKKIKFSADVEVYKQKTSKRIQGENMWRISAWVSRNSDGSGQKFSYESSVLTEDQSAQEFFKKDYNPPENKWVFKKLRYTFDGREGTCDDFRYFCIKFNMTDDPRPSFNLDFTYTVYREEYERETHCVRLGQCEVLSSDVPWTDRRPCVFRGGLRLHEETWTLDPCTLCVCNNGTSDCDIVTCPTPKCDNPVKVAGECCLLCPYKMQFFNIFNHFSPDARVIEGKRKKIKFSADVEVYKQKTSRRIRGENMWRISAWVSRNSDGSGQKFSYEPSVLAEDQSAQEFSKKDYNPPENKWVFKKLRYTFDGSEGTCDDFRYFCIKFNMTDDPRPAFDLDFSYTVYREEYERETHCVQLGQCEGVVAKTLDWGLIGQNPIPGQETSVSIDIDVTFRDDTRDLKGDGLWRVALFGSGNSLGEGPRFGEVAQILNDDESSTSIRGANPLEIDGIQTDFEYGSIGCVEDVNYICMEFLKGDAPNPDFTLTVEGVRGDVSRESMILCKEQECQSSVVFTELEWFREILEDHVPGTSSLVVIDARVDVEPYSTEVTGKDLWQVSVFASRDELGHQRRDPFFADILTPIEAGTSLPQGGPLTFSRLETPPFDVDKMGCGEFRYLCLEFRKSDNPVPDFIFETNSGENTIVTCHPEDCTDMNSLEIFIN